MNCCLSLSALPLISRFSTSEMMQQLRWKQADPLVGKSYATCWVQAQSPVLAGPWVWDLKLRCEAHNLAPSRAECLLVLTATDCCWSWGLQNTCLHHLNSGE